MIARAAWLAVATVALPLSVAITFAGAVRFKATMTATVATDGTLTQAALPGAGVAGGPALL